MNITPEEQHLLDLLGIKIKSSENQGSKQSEKAFKLIKTFVHCKLCGTVSIQLIRMVSTGGGTWIKEEEILISDLKQLSLPYEEYKTEVRTCSCCTTALEFREKSKLIEMLIDLANPLLSRQENLKLSWKEREREKENEDE